jgi:hypothetical protein
MRDLKGGNNGREKRMEGKHQSSNTDPYNTTT